jgi:outer membrane cobalamin receptor
MDNILLMSDIVKTVGSYTLRVSSGGRFPSFYELYSAFGSDDLSPQKTYGIDLFYKFSKGRLSIFAQRYADYINYDFSSNSYGNIDELDSYGIEGKFSLSSMISSTLIYKKIKNRLTNKVLPGRNTLTTTLSINPYRDFRLNYRGVFGRVGMNQEKLESLHYASIMSDFSFDFGVINLSVQNLFDEKSDSMFPTQNGGVITQLEFIRRL